MYRAMGLESEGNQRSSDAFGETKKSVSGKENPRAKATDQTAERTDGIYFICTAKWNVTGSDRGKHCGKDLYGSYSSVEKNEAGSKKGGQREMKKRLIMVMCCGIMILGNLSGCNAMKTKETEYHWPTSTLVKSLPVPESKYGEIVLDAEDSFEIDVFNTSKSQFADYINACKENGFNVDYYGTEDSYDAENKDGYTLSLSYDKRKKTMNIDIYDLDDDTEDTQEPEETEEPEETDDSENAKDTSKDSSRLIRRRKRKLVLKERWGS